MYKFFFLVRNRRCSNDQKWSQFYVELSYDIKISYENRHLLSPIPLARHQTCTDSSELLQWTQLRPPI